MKNYIYETEKGQKNEALLLSPRTEASNHIIRHLEILFPGRVILWCSETHQHWMYTENSATFFGFMPEELATKTYYDYRALIHPEDLTGYDLACRKIKQIKEELNPAEWGRYRFVMHYRVWRKTEYFQLREEQIFQLPGQEPGGHHALLTDVQLDYPFTCVQLDWYKVGPLGYTKINTYTPQNQESALSGRESEILRLLVEGFNSKQIAERLCISINTVRNHRANLLRKTNSHNLAQALKIALQYN